MIRPTRILTLLAVVISSLVVVSGPASAAVDDHEQVLQITFPFTADVDVRYRDDYDSCRSSDETGCVRHHQSTDMMVAMGTPIHAAMGGFVSWRSGSADGPPSYGWMLRISGDDGRDYAYVHMGAQDRPITEAYADGTEIGSRVEEGQLIGWAGCSGSAACGGGEHLHFEIHDPAVVDPYDHHDHERINPYPSLAAAEARGAYPERVAWAFTDVDPSSTHGRDVGKLAASGITRGCGGSRFCPDVLVTRQQMASFLVRALDLPDGTEGTFVDVAPSNVHRADIAALARSGITRGCGETTFCPGDPVTRAQMASFLVRALDLPAASDGFGDVDVDDVHAADIAALAAAGITKGCGTDRYCPDDPVTREQMASFLVRALDL